MRLSIPRFEPAKVAALEDLLAEINRRVEERGTTNAGRSPTGRTTGGRGAGPGGTWRRGCPDCRIRSSLTGACTPARFRALGPLARKTAGCSSNTAKSGIWSPVRPPWRATHGRPPVANRLRRHRARHSGPRSGVVDVGPAPGHRRSLRFRHLTSTTSHRTSRRHPRCARAPQTSSPAAQMHTPPE